MTPSSAHEADIQQIAATLSATPVGGICTYSSIEQAVGRSIRSCRWLALKAIRRVNVESGAVFSSVFRQGYKRLSADEVHTVGSTARGRMRRSARRTSGIIARAVDMANDMAPSAKRKALAEISTMNMVAYITTTPVSKVQEREDEAPPTIAASLEGLMKHIGMKATP